MKITKSCDNCTFRIHSICNSNDLCKRWVFKKGNCNWCQFYLDCESLGKEIGENVVCYNFTKSKKKKSTKQSRKPILMSDLEEEDYETNTDMFSPVGMIDKIIESSYDSSAFSLVDDSDIIKPTGMMQAITGSEFLNIELYPRQFSIFTEFLSACCPYCSDMKLLRTHEVDEKLSNLVDRTVMYVNGVCPKCKSSRFDAIYKKGLNPYNQLAGCAGQRSGKCIHGSSLVVTDQGVLTMKELGKGKPIGFSPFSINLSVNNSIEYKPKRTSRFYVEKPENLINLTLKNGYNIIGTRNHPILTDLGYCKLKDIKKDTYIPIEIGQNLWGSKIVNLGQVAKKAENLFVDKVENTKSKYVHIDFPYYRKGKLTKDIARFLGFWVAEGTSRGISNIDKGVLDDCEKVIQLLFGEANRGIDFVAWPGYSRATSYLESLISFDPFCRSVGMEVPLCIRQAPKEFVKEFLIGLFEGDGGFNGTSIEYCSISKTLVDHVSSLLHNFGIFHKKRKQWTWASNGSENQVSKRSYHIFIDGLGIHQFKDHIGFFSKRKNTRLDKTIARHNNRQLNMPFWYDKYPTYKKEEFLRCFEELLTNIKQHKSITNQPLGLELVLGINNKDMLLRMYSHNVPLTKRKVITLVNRILGSYISEKLPKKLITKLQEFYKSALNKNLYYTKVVSKTISKKKYKSYDFTVPYYHNFIANGINNHNSAACAIISAAITMYYLKLPNPVEYYGLLSNSVLHGTFVGLRYSDAYDNLWEPYYNLLKSTPWFKTYHEFLDSEGERIGKDLYKFKDSFVAYTHKQITAYPSGPDKRKLRGRTRFISALDEVGWFTGGEGSQMYDADEVYTALDNSLMTLESAARKLLPIYPDTPFAYGIYISSPRTKTDKIMRMYKQSKGSSKLFGFKLSTWEFNPNITKEDLKEKYRENPITAERDFGANPPFGNNPFIGSPASIVPLFSKKANLFKILKTETVRDSLGGRLFYPKIDFKKVHNFPSILTIDCSYNHDSFCCSLMHNLKVGEEMKLAMSGILEIKPDNYAISYPKVYEYCIKPILENFNVVLCAFDRWQSINLSQQIYQDFHIDTILYSVTGDDFDELKTELMSENYILPKFDNDLEDLLALDKPIDELIHRKPVSHLFLQLLMSTDTGRTVVKGDDITDDILRTMCLGNAFLLDEEYSNVFTGIGEESGFSNLKIEDIIHVQTKGKQLNNINLNSDIGVMSTRGRGI